MCVWWFRHVTCTCLLPWSVQYLTTFTARRQMEFRWEFCSLHNSAAGSLLAVMMQPPCSWLVVDRKTGIALWFLVKCGILITVIKMSWISYVWFMCITGSSNVGSALILNQTTVNPMMYIDIYIYIYTLCCALYCWYTLRVHFLIYLYRWHFWIHHLSNISITFPDISFHYSAFIIPMAPGFVT